jgi:thiamine pyrophosphokinase
MTRNLANLQYGKRYMPDEIRGDMDSIRPDVREYYESKVKKKIAVLFVVQL